MAHKGMSVTIQIIIVIVVILVAALTVLSIFAGGIGGAYQVIMNWIGQASDQPIPFLGTGTCEENYGECFAGTCPEGMKIDATKGPCPLEGGARICCVDE